MKRLHESVNLSVVVAAYNEEAVLKDNIASIVATLEDRPEVLWELVLVNDGSTDATGKIMENAADKDPRIVIANHKRNYGQGRALRTAFDLCCGQDIVTLDADLSYGPEYIWQLVDALDRENVEIALASAYTNGGRVENVPLHRHFLSRAANRYLSAMSDYPVSTLTCVVRAYRREVIDRLYLTSDGMELLLEILMKSSALNFRVTELPARLAWREAKAQDAKNARVSKMKILNSIRLYLQLGWLSRPAFATMAFGVLFLILPGIYMAAWLAYQTAMRFVNHVSSGDSLLWSGSYALEEVFAQFTYSFFVSGAMIVVGLQILLFSMIFLQNKFYYEDLYKLSQATVRRVDKMEKNFAQEHFFLTNRKN